MNTIVGDERCTGCREESERRRGDAVVNGEEIGGGVVYSWATAVFVGHDVFTVGKFRDGCHSWTSGIG